MRLIFSITAVLLILVPSLSHAFDDPYEDSNRRLSEWQAREERARIQRSLDNNRRSNSGGTNYYYNYHEKETYQEPKLSSGKIATGLALGALQGFIRGEQQKRRDDRRYSHAYHPEPVENNYHGPSQQEYDTKMRELDRKLAELKRQNNRRLSASSIKDREYACSDSFDCAPGFYCSEKRCKKR